MGCKNIKDEKNRKKLNPNVKKNYDISVSKLNLYFKSNIIGEVKEEEKKEYLEYLFKSYYSARSYFKSNYFKEKELDANKKLGKIYSALESLEKGESNKINIEELPKEINSEYITGYPNKERNEKIEYIISCLKKEKEESIIKKNKKLEELKKESRKIKKNEIEKFKEKSSKILDEEKNKIDLLSKQILKMNEILKNEYIPIPEIIKEEYCQIDQINEDIPENVLRITIGNLTYKKSTPLILFKILNLEKEIIIENEEELNETFDFNFFERNFNNLFQEKINITLLRKYKMKENKVKGTFQIPLNELKDNNKIEGSFRIKMESGKNDNFIDISIKIRKPLSIFKEVIKIKKFYPPFNKTDFFFINKLNSLVDNKMNCLKLEENKEMNKEVEIQEYKKEIINEGNKDNLNIFEFNENKEIKENKIFEVNEEAKDNKEMKEIKEIKENKVIEVNKEAKDNNKINENQEIKENKVIEVNKEAKDINENKNNKIKENEEKDNKIINNNILIKNKNELGKGNNNNDEINKNLFNEEELKDIDHINNLNSIKVLEDRLKKMEAKIAKIQGRTPKPLLTKKAKINVKLKLIKQDMGSGKIQPKDYLLLMENQYKKDIRMCKYLKQENKINEAKIVFSRIKLLEQEIDEFKKYYKNI